MFGRGLRLDTLRHTYKRAMGDLFKAQPTAQYGLASLAAFEAQVLDQGQTGSCEGHRAAMAVHVATSVANTVLPFFPSPDRIYREARAYSRSLNGGPSSGPLQDDGCMTSDVRATLGSYGVVPMTGPTSDGRNSDCEVSTVNREPYLNELVKGSHTLVLDMYDVDIGDPETAFATIQAALRAGHPVGLDVFADTIFADWGVRYDGTAGPIATCDTSDTNGGGHAILCTEAMSFPDTTCYLGGPNSWGAWGAGSIDKSGPNWTTGHWRGWVNNGKQPVGQTWFAQAVMAATVFVCTLQVSP